MTAAPTTHLRLAEFHSPKTVVATESSDLRREICAEKSTHSKSAKRY